MSTANLSFLPGKRWNCRIPGARLPWKLGASGFSVGTGPWRTAAEWTRGPGSLCPPVPQQSSNWTQTAGWQEPGRCNLQRRPFRSGWRAGGYENSKPQAIPPSPAARRRTWRGLWWCRGTPNSPQVFLREEAWLKDVSPYGSLMEALEGKSFI